MRKLCVYFLLISLVPVFAQARSQPAQPSQDSPSGHKAAHKVKAPRKGKQAAKVLKPMPGHRLESKKRAQPQAAQAKTTIVRKTSYGFIPADPETTLTPATASLVNTSPPVLSAPRPAPGNKRNWSAKFDREKNRVPAKPGQ
jgi:hypothetical protein